MKTAKILTALILTVFIPGISCAEGISYKHRNATAKIEYAGNIFLVDPFLAEKGAYPSFEGTPNSDRRIPLIDMVEPDEEVVKGIDAVILTHSDHWDDAEREILPKNIPFFVQNAGTQG